MKNLLSLLLFAFTLSCAGAYTLPSSKVPDGLGVNIHFTGEPSQDLDMIRDAGFRFIRMDFTWSSIERKKGKYDFAAYDQLVRGLQKRGIRAIFILDYSNELYERARSVQTEQGRNAFAKFAATAAKRYKGKGILWEMWNEPNITFWEPQPSLDAYMALVKKTIPAIKAADPGAICIAPATSGIDLAFLEGCFKKGLLNLVDAVSVHPYRQSNPETVIPEIHKLRALIVRYSPDKPNIPIISGEWGYSTAWGNFSDEIQGYYLPRQFLTNLSLDIPVSIWYDWHDDGPDPKEPEHRFGIVTQDYKPKPAYLAMKQLTAALSGMSFVKRMESDKKDMLLLFSDGKRHTIAAWTTGEKHLVDLYDGKTITLTPAPQYIPIPATAKSLIAEASWRVKQRSTGVLAGVPETHKSSPMFTITVHNPFQKKVKVKLSCNCKTGIQGDFETNPSFTLNPGQSKTATWNGRIIRFDLDSYIVTVKADIDGMRSSQDVEFSVANPQKADVLLLPNGKPAVSLTLPNYNSHTGDLTVTDKTNNVSFVYKCSLYPDPKKIAISRVDNGKKTTISPIITGGMVIVPLDAKINGIGEYRVVYKSGSDTILDSGTLKIRKFDVSFDQVKPFNDGDEKVEAEFKLYPIKATDFPIIGTSVEAFGFDYKYGKGWKFVRIAPNELIPITGKPKAIGVWVKGDGKGMSLRMRFVDATGRYFQSTYGDTASKEWRLMTAKLNDPSVGSWGTQGSPDKIEYPIKLDTLLIVDGKQDPMQGSIQFGGFQIYY